MTKRIIALVLALCVVFAFAACKKNDGDDNNTTTDSNAVSDENVGGVDADTPADESTEPETTPDGETVAPETTDSAAAEDTTKGSQSSATPSTGNKPQSLSTAADIVNYFNTAINKVKPSSKSVTSKYLKNSQVGKAQLGNLPSFVQSLANSLISSNMGEDETKKNVTYTSTADKNKNFPVEGQTWSSKLSASDVQSAKADPKNGGYVVTLVLKADAASDKVTAGTGHAPKAFSVVTPDQIYANAGGASSMISNVKVGFQNCKIIATVDANGNVTDAVYHMEWNLQLRAVGMDISIWFGIDQEFSIKW